jgi:hypothetical protein
MANRALMKCRSTGCSALVRGKYCEKHLHDNPRSNQRAEEWYGAAWAKFSKWLRGLNPLCQRLTNGVRCMSRSELVHHLISPRQRIDLLLDPDNCVCLCRAHHPVTEGSPEWRSGVDFVPTDSSTSLD